MKEYTAKTEIYILVDNLYPLNNQNNLRWIILSNLLIPMEKPQQKWENFYFFTSYPF